MTNLPIPEILSSSSPQNNDSSSSNPPSDPPRAPPDSSDDPTLPDPPPRTHKTHRNPEFIAFLKSLSRARRIALNSQIEIRNNDRDIQRFLHRSEPNSNADDASDDSSFVTISEPEIITPPTSPSKSFLQRFSPASKALFNKIFQKRSRDIDPIDDISEPIPKKQHRDTTLETKISPGSVITYGFHQVHYDLDKYHAYLPLSIFTNDNLRTILREANTLPLKKINPIHHKSKPPLVLDIDLFEQKYGREENLTHPAWLEAARNFVRFAGETGKDGSDGAWAERWDNHFGFFESRPDLISSFPSVLQLDIRMRKEYNAMPFEYSVSYYHEEYSKAIFDYRLKQIENTSSRSFSSLPTPSHSFAPNTSKLAPAFQPRQPLQNKSLPFRKGTSGDPSAAACLICGKKGHTFSGCTSTSFEDGRPVHSRVINNEIISPKSPNPLCRMWNIRGDGDKKCLHALSERAHLCSFCGDKSHFAFAWKCRSRPATSL